METVLGWEMKGFWASDGDGFGLGDEGVLGVGWRGFGGEGTKPARDEPVN